MKIVKCKVTKIAKSPKTALWLKEIAERAHEIKTTLYLLCKLCIVARFKEGSVLPKTKAEMERLFKDAHMILPKGKKIVGEQQEELRRLCTDAFPRGGDDQPYTLDTKGLCSDWRSFEAERYAVLIMNHIKANYMSCLKNFIALLMHLSFNDKNEKAEIHNLADAVAMKKKVPNDLAKRIEHLVPNYHPTKDNYFYDVKIDTNTLAYLPCMLYMCQELEKKNAKLKGVLPLIRANIPGTTMLFTGDLERLLPEEFMMNANGVQVTKTSLREESGTPKKRDADGNLLCKGKDPERTFTDAEWAEKEEKRVAGQIKMWSMILDFSKSPLKSGSEWRFDTKMQTDGVSCSMYMEKSSVQTMKKAAKGAAFKQHDKELYVQDLSDDDKHELNRRRVISVDPGKNNIIMCYENGTSDYDEEHRILMDKGRTFRYTKKQRDHDTNRLATQKAAEERKKKQPPLGGKTLQQWEEALSNFNSKTVDPTLFQQYIGLVTRYQSHVRKFYSKTMFRKERFNAYRLQQKSESNMVKTFMTKMQITKTQTEEVVIAFGDGARDNTKGRAPGPSTSIRKLFQRNHLKVIDVGEAWTSKRCFHCKSGAGVNEPCRKMENKKGKLVDVWGLCRCELCSRPWSRDYHACLNIAYLALEHLQGHSRPAYLCGGTLVRKQQNAHHTLAPGLGT
jgi:hypothetical protein